MFEILKDGLHVLVGTVLGYVFMMALVMGIFIMPYLFIRLAIGGF